jgi:membrane fusion protein (multidrug efflux system)
MEPEQHAEEEHHRIVVTRPLEKEVVVSERYVCQIHARRTIEVRSLERGYLDEIRVKEGQMVKKGDVMFTLVPVLYKAKLDADLAEAQFARVELDNAERLFKQNIVSAQEVALYRAKLAKAEATVNLARAELEFTTIRAPFDGLVDRLHEFNGSLIEEGDLLTSLSDNSVMWVYFNVPEARYLEYMRALEDERPPPAPSAAAAPGRTIDYLANLRVDEGERSRRVELVLANGRTFPYPGKIAAIEAQFNNETGTVPFRADFPNPNGLLRHGQTGNVVLSKTLKNALVIPQRATFEILDKQYVYVVDAKGVVHQRRVMIQHELDDIYVIESGLSVKDKIILDGIRQVRDGDHVEYEFRKPEQALSNLKYHAE